MIPPGFLQDLLSRVDIVEVVGRHVELKKGGANHMGLCPFHGEKSPSFTRQRRASSSITASAAARTATPSAS